MTEKKKYQKGEIVEALISDAGEKDRAFAKLDDGISLFVRGPVAPGDRVEVEIYRIKRRFLEGRLKNVLEPAPTRVDPRCAHFGLCGGCKWQHIQYEEQLRLKSKMVEDALAHVGGFKDPPMEDPIPAASLFGYRNKIDFSFADKRFVLPDEPTPPVEPVDFAVGFHAPGVWQKVLHIDECHIATPEMNEILSLVRAFCLEQKLTPFSSITKEGFLRSLIIRHGVQTQQWMVNLVTSWHEAEAMKQLADLLNDRFSGNLTTVVNNVTTRPNTSTLGEEEFIISGPGYIEEEIAGCRFRISANSFFQTNTLQTEALYRTVLDWAEIQSGETVYDLFCGAGSISLPAARQAGRVLGLEWIEDAVRDAEGNAQRNGVDNCTFKVFDLNKVKKRLEEFEAFGRPDTIITDPPRAGMHPKAVEVMVQLRPQRIVYVSCKPASLARDGAMLCASGEYRLTRVKAVDLFPQTQHIESVALFERV